MELARQYNSKSPAVKRLMREACEMQEPTQDYSAAPINDNLFEWHFTIRGAPDTEFEGGIYHGRIIFPSEYPMKPPNIVLLTPNGRFETNKKICLTISGHHPETWQPSWCVRTALLALIAFMPTPGNGTIGYLDYTKEERQQLARKSKTWECNECGKISDLLLPCDDAKSSCNEKKTVSKDTESEAKDTKTETSPIEAIVDEYDRKKVAMLLEETNKLLSKSDSSLSNANVESDVQYENVDTAMPIPSLNGMNSYSSTSSNISNSALTVGAIVAVIAFLLFRRIFLLY